ncbi:DNA cytosine methyltransferase [Cryptosporangium japonicum]|uniref:DNA (cytosine-5-)-methyltransferase n=1 Tax=Cryptosporangium japonicum TaxID=80872 RepID=A0ABP3E9N0_9ACTN
MSLRLLDLCCGQGGASRGYVDAGFEVVGVDLNPQPRYPFTFIQANALDVLQNRAFVAGFDAIHASFPCQAFLTGTLAPARDVPDLITPGRPLLDATGLPWVMEDVMPAPLDPARSIVLCGEMFALRTIRHRRFEPAPGLPLTAPRHVLPHRRRTAHSRRRELWAAGYHASFTGDIGTYAGPEGMGIDWMTGNGLSEAIPPAYTRCVGTQLLEHLTRSEVAA